MGMWSKIAIFDLNPRKPLIYSLVETVANVSRLNFILKMDLLTSATVIFVLKSDLLTLAAPKYVLKNDLLRLADAFSS